MTSDERGWDSTTDTTTNGNLVTEFFESNFVIASFVIFWILFTNSVVGNGNFFVASFVIAGSFPASTIFSRSANSVNFGGVETTTFEGTSVMTSFVVFPIEFTFSMVATTFTTTTFSFDETTIAIIANAFSVAITFFYTAETSER